MDLPRLRGVWRRVFALAWPVMAEQTFRTAMRTTDVLVTALFSPAAVVAIGLADLYARFPLRIGLGLGGGAIALSSQDTGADATANRDEAVTQAILIGALAGVPFVLVGLFFGEPAIGLFGRLVGERTAPEVVALGSTYLAVVFATAPARHVALVGARALQGTGDTRTPMYVNVAANALNIVGSVVLGLGLFGLPRLEVLGVGLATAGANVLTAGLLFGEVAIGVFGRLVGEGASPAVVDLGSTYLAVVFATAPARHVALVGARALQGTGDTRTPMYVNVAANALNIAGSVVLGLGLFGAPRLEVLGVGLATAGANALTAGLLCVAIWGPWTEASFARPRDLTIAGQLLRVSAPRVAEGFGSELAEFPFNALLLGFGEAVNAGFQIGRRVYQQVTGPLSRGYNVAASVLVGQALGAGDPDEARFDGWAVAGLAVLTVGAIGLALVAAAPRLVPLFTDDAPTVRYAVDFARVYGVAGAALACFSALSGSLQGASETRIPLVARASGMFGLFLGASWLLGRTAGLGPSGAYVGVTLAYGWMALVVAAGFRHSGWAGRAAAMMAERGSGVDDPEVDEAEEPATD